MPDDEDNAFGKYLHRKRTEAQLSFRAAARKAGFSEGRWRQLERGYQPSGTGHVPANPRATTVVQAADALGADPEEALKIAGLTADVAAVREQIEQMKAKPIIYSSEQADNEAAAASALGALASEAIANGSVPRVISELVTLLTAEEVGWLDSSRNLLVARIRKDKAELAAMDLPDPDELADEIEAHTPDDNTPERIRAAWGELANNHHFYSVAYSRAWGKIQRVKQLRRLINLDPRASNKAMLAAAEPTVGPAIEEAKATLAMFRESRATYEEVADGERRAAAKR